MTDEELRVKITAEVGDFKKACKDATSSINDMGKDGEKATSNLQKSFEKLGKVMATVFTAKKVIDFGKQCVQAAADIEAANSAFNSTLGGNADAMTQKLKDLGNETGITYTRMTEAATQYYNKWAQAGFDAQKAMDMTAQALRLGADAAAYYNMSLEEANDHIKSFINGNLNAGDAIGIATNATQIHDWAVEHLGVSYKDASEAQKQAIRQEYIDYMYSVSGVMGQASRESGAYENVMGNLNEAWKQFQAVVGQPILEKIVIPALTKATQIMGEASKKVQEVYKWVKEHKELLITVAEVIGGVIAVVTVINGLMTAYTAVMGVVAAVTSGALLPFIAITAGIAALVAAIILCIKHWDEIKETISRVVESIKQKVEEMVEKVRTKFEDMKNNMKQKVDDIKTSMSEKFNAVKETITGVMETCRSVAQEKLNNIKRAYDDAGGGIKGVVNATWTAIKDYYQTGFNVINNLTGGKLGQIANEFTNKFSTIKNAVSNAMSQAHTAFSNALNNIWNTCSNIVSRISNAFSNIRISIPHITLPHLSVWWEDLWGWFSIPHVSVNWYAKGGVFDNPTLFGYGNGQLGGLGENGAEAVVPLENNLEWLDKLAERLNEKMGGQSIVLEVDGKVFGQVACDSINNLTRQTGRLNLVMG